MSKKKKIVFIIAVFVLIVLIGLFFSFSRKQKLQYITEKVEPRDLTQTVSATGELVSEGKINLNFEVSGKLKSVITAGKQIVTNDVIGQLDNFSLNKETEKKSLILEKVKAENGINDDKISEAERTMENAEDYLEEVEKLEDEKVEAADQDYQDALDYYEAALNYYNKIVDEEGTDENSTALYAKLTLETAEKNKNAAEKNKDTTRRSRNLNIVSAENNYKLAKDQYETAKSDFTQTTKNLAVESAQVDYEIALGNLEKAALKAPVNGLITKINYKVGELISNGLATSLPFAEIISYDFIVESNIPESDIAFLELGKKAEITFDSLSEDEVFLGEIIEIEPTATVIQDVVYYKTKFKLENFNQKLKAGMSCDLEIKIDEKKQALAVSQRAVKKDENGREQVLILLNNGQTKEVSVKSGLEDDEGWVEIISGLQAGEEIILAKEEK